MKRTVTKQETTIEPPPLGPAPEPGPVEQHDHLVAYADGYALLGDGTTQITQHCACGAQRVHRERMATAAVEENTEWTVERAEPTPPAPAIRNQM